MFGILCLVFVLPSYCAAQYENRPQYAEAYKFTESMFQEETDQPWSGALPFTPQPPQLMCTPFAFNGTCTEAGLTDVQFFYDASNLYERIERKSKIYMLMGIEVSANLEYTALAANQSVSEACKKVFPRWFCTSEAVLLTGLCFNNGTAGALPCHSTCMEFASNCYNQTEEEIAQYCSSMAAAPGAKCFA